MRAVTVAPDRSLVVADKPDPEPGPGEVVVAVERCGICGSDLHLHGSGFMPVGAVMGHEFGGTIVAVGDGVADRRTGERVAVLPSQRDGTCELCRAGRSHLCTYQMASSIGLGVHDGGYAELARAAASSCYPLPNGTTPEQGALVEPYAVALHAVRRSRAAVDPTLNVGVIGAGPVGLLTVAALRRAGVQRITVAERSDTRRAVAETLGATTTDDATRLARAAGDPLDVVFDAAGAPATLPVALEAAAMGGQVVLVGVIDIGQTYDMPGLMWVVKEVDVLTSIAYTDDEFADAVADVAAGAVDAGRIVSDVRPLEGASTAFDELRRPGGPVKVLLDPSL